MAIPSSLVHHGEQLFFLAPRAGDLACATFLLVGTNLPFMGAGGYATYNFPPPLIDTQHKTLSGARARLNQSFITVRRGFEKVVVFEGLPLSYYRRTFSENVSYKRKFFFTTNG